jgi:hypothetical protein
VPQQFAPEEHDAPLGMQPPSSQTPRELQVSAPQH